MLIQTAAHNLERFTMPHRVQAITVSLPQHTIQHQVKP